MPNSRLERDMALVVSAQNSFYIPVICLCVAMSALHFIASVNLSSLYLFLGLVWLGLGSYTVIKFDKGRKRLLKDYRGGKIF